MKRYHDGGALVEIVSLDGNGNFMSSEVRPFSDFEITDVLTGKTRVSQEWTDLLARRRFKGVTLLKVNRFDEVETPKIEHRPEHRKEVPVQTLRPRREIRSEVLGPAMPRLMDAGWTVQAFKEQKARLEAEYLVNLGTSPTSAAIRLRSSVPSSGISATSVTANFTLQTFTLTITRSGAATGIFVD
jgi:hypothetical protein